MQTLSSITELRSTLKQARAKGQTIGFVPTMGNLHAGHISLITAARQQCDIVIASIFVNPLQFGVNEDLDTYPRTLEQDQALLQSNACDLLFAPSVREMYPNGTGVETVVDLPELSPLHCGITRPHFFKGVATVVVKLFGIVQPDYAFFGAKDRQQLTIIRRVVADLSIPVTIVGVDTARDEHGLALSSRNSYLSESERHHATFIYRLLTEVSQRILDGQQDYPVLEKAANQQLAEQGFEPDYFHICQKESLQPATVADRELAILVAAKLKGTRLIDNLTVSLPA